MAAHPELTLVKLGSHKMWLALRGVGVLCMTMAASSWCMLDNVFNCPASQDLKEKAPLRHKFGVADEWVLPYEVGAAGTVPFCLFSANWVFCSAPLHYMGHPLSTWGARVRLSSTHFAGGAECRKREQAAGIERPGVPTITILQI